MSATRLPPIETLPVEEQRARLVAHGNPPPPSLAAEPVQLPGGDPACAETCDGCGRGPATHQGYPFTVAVKWRGRWLCPGCAAAEGWRHPAGAAP